MGYTQSTQISSMGYAQKINMGYTQGISVGVKGAQSCLRLPSVRVTPVADRTLQVPREIGVGGLSRAAQRQLSAYNYAAAGGRGAARRAATRTTAAAGGGGTSSPATTTTIAAAAATAVAATVGTATAAAGAAAAAAGASVDMLSCAPVLEDSLLNNGSMWLLKQIMEVTHKQPLHAHGDQFLQGNHGAGLDILEMLLPTRFHAIIHANEVQAAIILREVIVLLMCAALLFSVEGFCRSLECVWRKVYIPKMDDPDASDSEKENESGTVTLGDGTTLTLFPPDAPTGYIDESDTRSCQFKDSPFAAAVIPLKFIIVAFFFTRHVRMLLPLVNVRLRPVLVRQLRMSAVAVAFGTFLLRLKNSWMRGLMPGHNRNKPILSSISRFLALFIRVATAIVLFDIWRIPFQNILAIGGVSGVAVGFASKEIFTNFFGGLVLFFSQPFVVGDNIKAVDVMGFVREIGFLHTVVEGVDYTPITVPNSMFLSAVIVNYSRAVGKLLDLTVFVQLEDLSHVKPITQMVTAVLISHPRVDSFRGPTMAYLKAVGPHSLQIGIVAPLKPMNKKEFLEMQHHFLQEASSIVTSLGAQLGATPPELYKPTVGSPISLDIGGFAH